KERARKRRKANGEMPLAEGVGAKQEREDGSRTERSHGLGNEHRNDLTSSAF
ncbi:hypothetical protein KXV73_004026, partial [Aspergillus fumigatus]